MAILGDWATTRSIARSNGRYQEVGVIARKAIGSRPSTGRVDKYFAGVILLNAAIHCYAPKEFARVWAWMSVVDHGSKAVHNYNIGLKFDF